MSSLSPLKTAGRTSDRAGAAEVGESSTDTRSSSRHAVLHVCPGGAQPEILCRDAGGASRTPFNKHQTVDSRHAWVRCSLADVRKQTLRYDYLIWTCSSSVGASVGQVIFKPCQPGIHATTNPFDGGQWTQDRMRN